jgi:Domain of unknown function (DUF4352)
MCGASDGRGDGQSISQAPHPPRAGRLVKNTAPTRGRGFILAPAKSQAGHMMPRFCHSCGAALVDGGAFCSGCGTPLNSARAPVVVSPLRSAFQQAFTPIRPSTPAGHKSRSGRLGVLVFLLVCAIIAFVIKFAPSDTAVNIEAVPVPPENNTVAPPPARHRIGEDFSVGYWSYRCNGARWQSMIPSLGTAEIPDAEFLVVDLYMRNNDRTASTAPPLKLVDAQGREYDESSKGTFMPGALDVLKKLNPQVSSRGYAVFDAPRGKYALLVSGGFESGEHALVDLSPPTKNDEATDPVHFVPANPGTDDANKTGVSTEDSRPASSLGVNTQTRAESTPSGPHRFVLGVLENVHCDNPALDLNVFSNGNILKLHTDNYFNVQYTVLNVTLKGDLNPCADLEGRPAKVEYVGASDGPGLVIGIELHK